MAATADVLQLRGVRARSATRRCAPRPKPPLNEAPTDAGVSVGEHRALIGHKGDVLVRFGQRLLMQDEDRSAKAVASVRKRCEKERAAARLAMEQRITEKKRTVRRLRETVAEQDALQRQVGALRKHLDAKLSDQLTRELADKRAQRDALLAADAELQEALGETNRQRAGVMRMQGENESLTKQNDQLRKRERYLRHSFFRKERHALKSEAGARFLRSRLTHRKHTLAAYREAWGLAKDDTRPFLAPAEPPEDDQGEQVEAREAPHGDEEGDKRRARAQRRREALLARCGEGPDEVWRKEMTGAVDSVIELLSRAMEAYYWVKASTKCKFCNLDPPSNFVGLRTGAMGCRACLEQIAKSEGGFFEDESFSSVSTRLSMNAGFEASIDAVLNVLRDDLECLRRGSIARLKTRFAIYTSILYLQPTNLPAANRADKAREAARRIARIWRINARARGRARELAAEAERMRKLTRKSP